MAETTETVDTEETESTDTETQENESTEDVEIQDETEEEVDPAAGLKTALQKERTSNKANAKRIKELQREIADRDKSPDEKALDEARREAAAEATSAANKRILRTEIRAVAKGRLADPADALLYLDADTYIDDDGEVDADAIEEAISELLTKRPYLGVDTGEKFRGSADQGARGKGSKPSQMTHEDVKKLSAAGRHDEIVKAEREGRLNNLMKR